MQEIKPVIIPRDHHTLSRKQLSRNALKVMYRLREKGFIAYLVGGGVRDVLLGREPKDFDIVTDATPGQIKKIFRNSRIIGRRFRLAHIHFGDEIVEVATFRSNISAEPEPVEELESEPEHEGHRHPRHLRSEEGLIIRDNVFGTPEQDAFRRDFTVNALCYDINNFSIIDFVGGMDDLQQGIIRTIGDPWERFVEDPVRMLRAVRFAALLGFEIEKDTWQAMVQLSSHITKSSPPRLYEEMLKLFLNGTGERAYQLLRQAGLLQSLFPHYTAWLSTESDGFPHNRGSKGLAWLDERIAEKKVASQQLLVALLFGEYLQDKVERLKGSGIPFHGALNEGVARFLEELAPTVLIPQRIGVQVRDILSAQQRFRKTPGRHAPHFLARPETEAAFTYLEFMGSIRKEESRLHAWWVKFKEENPLPTAEGPAKKGRRRRRRRRPPVEIQAETG